MIGADGAIGGFTVMNDWSARDLQRGRCGRPRPGEGQGLRDALGPVVVTPDEFDGTEAEMVARVNGEERSRGNLARPLPLVGARSVAHAARNTVSAPAT